MAVDGVVVGVDLGGTSIRAAVATGATSHEEAVVGATPAAQGSDAVVDAVAAAVRKAAAGRPLAGMSIGIPGPLSPAEGIVYSAPHLAGWVDFPAQAELERRLGCPVSIHNDASLAGYAEFVAGAGRNSDPMLFITVSTGIGGALICGGELAVGAAGTGGEVGHMVIQKGGPTCAEGHPGCLEGIASGTAIARQARAALEKGEPSSLLGVDPVTLSAADVGSAAAAGDPLALSLYAAAGDAVGEAIGGLINLLSPEVVVVGGGLIHAGDLLFGPLRSAIPRIAFPVPYARCRVVEAGLGTDAGLVGAVAWAMKMHSGDMAGTAGVS